MQYITKKIVYVVKALYYLEVVRGNQNTSVMEISEQLEVPKRFLEQLFLRLRKQDVLESIRGAQGGYRLLRPLNEITFHEIAQIVSDSHSQSKNTRGSGLFGEDAFVAALQSRLLEDATSITLGSLVDGTMRRRASTGKGGGYVYQI